MDAKQRRKAKRAAERARLERERRAKYSFNVSLDCWKTDNFVEAFGLKEIPSYVQKPQSLKGTVEVYYVAPDLDALLVGENPSHVEKPQTLQEVRDDIYGRFGAKVFKDVYMHGCGQPRPIGMPRELGMPFGGFFDQPKIDGARLQDNIDQLVRILSDKRSEWIENQLKELIAKNPDAEILIHEYQDEVRFEVIEPADKMIDLPRRFLPIDWKQS